MSLVSRIVLVNRAGMTAAAILMLAGRHVQGTCNVLGVPVVPVSLIVPVSSVDLTAATVPVANAIRRSPVKVANVSAFLIVRAGIAGIAGVVVLCADIVAAPMCASMDAVVRQTVPLVRAAITVAADLAPPVLILKYVKTGGVAIRTVLLCQHADALNAAIPVIALLR